MVVIDRVSDDPYMSAAGIYDVHKIANNEKTVPRAWLNETADYVTEEFINYIEPLIQGDYPPFMVNGLPQHLVLKKITKNFFFVDRQKLVHSTMKMAERSMTKSWDRSWKRSIKWKALQAKSSEIKRIRFWFPFVPGKSFHAWYDGHDPELRSE